MSVANTTADPLEEKKIDLVDKTGKCTSVSALDAAWAKDMDLLPYCSPHCASLVPTSDISWIDPVWTEAMGMLDDDLQHLLEMNHHEFWCQVIYDASLQRAIDSYLQHGPRPFDCAVILPDDDQQRMKSIHQRMFAVLLRLSTHKEGPENFMSPDFYAKTIYDKRLFDMPKLLDLCAIYGEANKELVAKMVGNIFKRQPRYEEDWGNMVGVVLGELSAVCERVMGADREVLRLANHVGFSASDFTDLVFHLADLASTLRSFLTIYPPSIRELMRAHFIERVVEFYEAVVPSLQETWHGIKGNLRSALYLKKRFRSLKMDLVWLVHQSLQVWYFSPPPADSSGVRSKVSMDSFVAVMSDMASEPNFLREYKKYFDVVEDVQSIQRAHPEMPEDQFDYLLSALEETPTVSSREVAHHQPLPSSRKKEEHVPDGAVMDSLVSQVKDLLPHLGAGFIKICLLEFGNNPEALINCVFEDSLPPHLKDMDFSLTSEETPAPLPETRVKDEPHRADSLVDKRESVYDGDEFDVFSRPDLVDLSRIHVGKRFDPISAASVLDDKSHLLETRDRYAGFQIETKYGYVSEDQACRLEMDEDYGERTPYVPGLDIMYEDEYDDTYDSQNVGAADDATDEQFVVKRLNKKGFFGKKLYNSSDEDEEKEEKRSVIQHPVILKRPDQRTYEQRQALQSVKGLISNISEQGKHGRDAREKQVKDRQESWRSGPRNGEEWRKKGDKANWRERDREEQNGGVVEVKTGEKRGGRRGGGQKEEDWRSRTTGRGGRREGGQKEEDWRSRTTGRGGRREGGQKEEDWRSRTTGREGRNLEMRTVEDKKGGSHRQEGSLERHGGDKEVSTSKKRHDVESHKEKADSGQTLGGRGAGREDRCFDDRPPGLTSKHKKGTTQPPGRRFKEWTPPSTETGHHEETSSVSESRERGGQGAKKHEEGSGQSASNPNHSELKARQAKDRNKSTRANHNRKNLADKKRRGGMM